MTPAIVTTSSSYVLLKNGPLIKRKPFQPHTLILDKRPSIRHDDMENSMGDTTELVDMHRTVYDSIYGTCGRSTWKGKWNYGPLSKLDVILCPILTICTVVFYSGTFLHWNEERLDIKEYALLHDPIHPHFEPVDFSVPLFFLAYGSVVGGILYSRRRPDLMLEFMATYFLVIWVRMISLYLTPLEPPVDNIPLADPVAHGEAAPHVRDLFFSGHTSTTFTVFFTCRNHHLRWKVFFLAMGVMTAAMVIVQKTHYVIDVFAAPFFVYTCHRVVLNLRISMGIAHGYSTMTRQ